LVAIPEKDITITFLPVAAQTGGHAILRDALAAAAQGPDVVDGLGGITAIEATASCEQME
jgi:hypothetical protein